MALLTSTYFTILLASFHHRWETYWRMPWNNSVHGCHCDSGATLGKRPKPIFFMRNRCKMGQLDVFRLYIFRFGHFGVPRGPPRGSWKSSKSSSKFWREDVGYLIIRPDILNIRPNLFHILESAQPRFITHFRRSKRKVTVLPPYGLAAANEQNICF